jgi:hypothetical protein
MKNSKNPKRCAMDGCKGHYVQSKTNQDYFVCDICGIGIWKDYKTPDTSRKNIIESEGAIQYRYGLNTRKTGGKAKNKGGSRSGGRKRQKPVKKGRNPELLQV